MVGLSLVVGHGGSLEEVESELGGLVGMLMVKSASWGRQGTACLKAKV